MATFVVNTEQDNIDPNDDLLSLREAIEASNANEGRDRIVVSWFLDGPIEFDADMPELTDSVIFNGRGATLETDGGVAFEADVDGLSITLKNFTLTAQSDGLSLLVVGVEDADIEVDDVTIETGNGVSISAPIYLSGAGSRLEVSNVDGTQASGQFIQDNGIGNTVHMDDVDLVLGETFGAVGLIVMGTAPTAVIENSSFVSGAPDSQAVLFNHEQPFNLSIEDTEFAGFTGNSVLIDANDNGGALTLIDNRFEDNEVGVALVQVDGLDFTSRFNTFVENDVGFNIADDVAFDSARSTFDTFIGNEFGIINDAAGALAVRFGTFLGNGTNIAGSGITEEGFFGF